ncbi:histidine phosphatase family protein [Shimia thalassica]|uniref:histidine phosphatase family protein n=1 Tax=Shimia thalassica TaxID=1715693 RepID=UPI0026E33628|nr:histidine phosphatase family protein [Shimia thalassica]MDO6485067.1 histidine phosphatase family protein [Shimia thalassica]
MIRFAMMRHGHTEWNRAHRIQGRTDIPLDDQARLDLSAFRLPQGWQDADLYASPLLRARDTAKIVARRDPDTVDALIEMDWGKWEGLKGVDLKADPDSGFRDIEYWGWDYRPPEGESPAEVWARVAPWLFSLTRDSIAVCHIGTMRMVLAQATGWDFLGPAPFAVKRNRLFVVEVDDATVRIADPDIVRLERTDT